jgi:hypothetical protein
MMATETPQADRPKKKRFGCLSVVVLLGVLIGLWLLIRPGVFTVQPIGALPEGVTFVYHSRNPEMPFFSSPDGLCLQIQGSVNLLCRAAGIGAINELSDRILIKLPYSRWAYVRSTGGLEFEQ